MASAHSRLSSDVGNVSKVGAVEPGGAVEIHAALAELGHDVALRRRALEEHVLEQVRHAGLAVVLHPRADEVSDVDRGFGLRRVGEEQDPQAVVEPVLRDALDGGALSDPGRQRRCGGTCRCDQDAGEE
jgi:hypothetical protein